MKSFLNLSLAEQIRELYLEGSFVIDIRYYKYKINLYLYANHYVEVFINDKNSRIEKIEPLPFESTRLKFYTDQLKIGRNNIREKRGYCTTLAS
ncbi:MAG: hypothetical protein RIG77_01105 [Cyclobacteriaceae bacterium]